MKKLLVLFVLLAVLVGCSSQPQTKVIKVGASVTPHAEILKYIADDLKAKGYTLEVIEYTDYVQPNLALDKGDIDANYFQHQPYLTKFNTEHKLSLVDAGKIHYEPFALYGGSKKSLNDLAAGDKIAVPNDATNEARALQLLAANELIKLKDGVGLNATKQDIVENPKNLDIVELEAAQLSKSLSDVAFAVINGNYAIQANLSVKKDALLVEDEKSEAANTFANLIAVKSGKENDEGIKLLVSLLKSDKVKKFVDEKYNGGVIVLTK